MAALPALVAKAVREYREVLERDFPDRVRQVLVFGSMARGEAHAESDVDVLALLDRIDERERRHAMDLAAEIGFASDLAIAPLVLSQDEWDELVRRERLLPREIARDGLAV